MASLAVKLGTLRVDGVLSARVAWKKTAKPSVPKGPSAKAGRLERHPGCATRKALEAVSSPDDVDAPVLKVRKNHSSLISPCTQRYARYLQARAQLSVERYTPVVEQRLKILKWKSCQAVGPLRLHAPPPDRCCVVVEPDRTGAPRNHSGPCSVPDDGHSSMNTCGTPTGWLSLQRSRGVNQH